MVAYEFIFARVWIYSQEHKAVRQWHLIVRRDIESKSDIKYTLSNASVETPKQQLAYMQGQRYWVERSFEEGKQNCGMADYQHRRWLRLVSSYGFGHDGVIVYDDGED
jgi:hypothetical protein